MQQGGGSGSGVLAGQVFTFLNYWYLLRIILVQIRYRGHVPNLKHHVNRPLFRQHADAVLQVEQHAYDDANDGKYDILIHNSYT